MSILRQATTDYFAVRRALGFKLVRSEKLLGQFVTYLEQRGEVRITTEMAVAWAILPQAGQTWAYARLSVVRRFATYMRSIDPDTEVPPTHILVQKKGRATPFLYSPADLAALMDATKALRLAEQGVTLRTLILLLSVTGMRIGEAIRLDVEDFDLGNGILVVRNTKFGKTREVPLHQTTATALSSYLGRENQPKRRAGTRALFLSATGTRLDYNRTQQTFRQLVEAAGLRPRSASCRPRLHDLRHTFAVETILDGYRDGNEPGNRIALLSTYLGHVDPASTYWYLSAAPELLALACARLERGLGGAA
uniref:Integrase family protein n=1 Tax=Rhizobium rhizogenes TaxID=359 RepID=A0A7S5DRG9_RHIRH|nr:tyrosine-type recombinase/integrase [Rhizobium rhizogenes]QCL09626.1 integrase family protein [Rhizobium rhizogenes]